MVFKKKKQDKNQSEFLEEDVGKIENVEESYAQKEKDEEKMVFKVVKELPVSYVRKEKLEDGTIVNYITIEEALTEFINEK